MRRRRIGLAAVVAAAFAALLLLHALGPRTSSPRSLGWSDLEGWYEDAGAAAGAVAVVRGLAMAGAVWLVSAATLQLVASFRLGARCASVADRLSPSVLRGVAHLAVTAGLAMPTASAEPLGDGPGTAVMVPLDIEAPEPPAAEAPEAPDAPVPPAPPAPPVEPVAPPAPPAPVAEEVVVARGESFWSIAAEQSGERDLVAYWQELIELNRDRLVDPGNPDLLYPSQLLRLPSP